MVTVCKVRYGAEQCILPHAILSDTLLRAITSPGAAVARQAASLPVHASGRYRRNTVLEILESVHGLPGLKVVHRLDRVTSGVVLLARTPEVRPGR